MDCCNFPEYRPQYGWGEAYGAYGQPYGAPAATPYAYVPYASYAPEYATQHDHYARYSAYHYGDYPPPAPHAPHPHASPLHRQLAEHLEYGGGGGGGAGYVAREARARRVQGRREAERTRARTPVAPHHLPLPHTPTPPLDCGSMVGRVAGGYCDPHMSSWTHYQMSGGGGGGGAGDGAGCWGVGWDGRGGGGGGGPLHRDPLRHLAAMHDHCALRNAKGHNMSMIEQLGTAESRVGPFSSYEEAIYSQRPHDSSSVRPLSRLAPEYVDYSSAAASSAGRRSQPPSSAGYERRERIKEEPPQPPPTPPRAERPAAPATVPLPAFQQAFGSTEIGRFAEAFSRAEAAHDAELAEGESVAARLAVELFPEWESADASDPSESAWPSSSISRPIKCENSY